MHERRRAEIPQYPLQVAKRNHRVDAHGRVVVVFGIQLRMHAVPEVFKQAADQAEARIPPGHAGRARPGRGEVDGGAQVLGPAQHGPGQFGDLVPVGFLGRLDAVANGAFGLRRGGAFECEKLGVVFQIVACRRFISDRCQQRLKIILRHGLAPPSRWDSSIITNYSRKTSRRIHF